VWYECIISLYLTHVIIDSDWSKDETDYLFDMCKRFDLRFIVIADRYSFEGKERTLEASITLYIGDDRLLNVSVY
jgi:hypothetical protein